MAREKMWARIHLIPMLQAECDRDLVRRHLADQAREKELLGENFKVYNSDRYVFFSFFFFPCGKRVLILRVDTSGLPLRLCLSMLRNRWGS